MWRKKIPRCRAVRRAHGKFSRLLKRKSRRSGSRTTCLLSIFVSAARPHHTGPDRSGRSLLFLSPFWLRSVKRQWAELYLIVRYVVDCSPEVWTTWYQMQRKVVRLVKLDKQRLPHAQLAYRAKYCTCDGTDKGRFESPVGVRPAVSQTAWLRWMPGDPKKMDPSQLRLHSQCSIGDFAAGGWREAAGLSCSGSYSVTQSPGYAVSPVLRDSQQHQRGFGPSVFRPTERKQRRQGHPWR